MKTILNASKIGAQISSKYRYQTVSVSCALSSLILMLRILNVYQIRVPQIMKFFLKMDSVSSAQTIPILTIPKTSKNVQQNNALFDKLPSCQDSAKIAHHINFHLDQLEPSTNAKMFRAPKIRRSTAQTEIAGHARNILILTMTALFALLKSAIMKRKFLNWMVDAADVISSSILINQGKYARRMHAITPLKFYYQLVIAKTALWPSIQM